MEADNSSLKTCRVCNKTKTLSAFKLVRKGKADKTKLYYASYCKCCEEDRDNWSVENYLKECCNEEEIETVKQTLLFLKKFRIVEQTSCENYEV